MSLADMAQDLRIDMRTRIDAAGKLLRIGGGDVGVPLHIGGVTGPGAPVELVSVSLAAGWRPSASAVRVAIAACPLPIRAKGLRKDDEAPAPFNARRWLEQVATSPRCTLAERRAAERYLPVRDHVQIHPEEEKSPPAIFLWINDDPQGLRDALAGGWPGPPASAIKAAVSLCPALAHAMLAAHRREPPWEPGSTPWGALSPIEVGRVLLGEEEDALDGEMVVIEES